MKPKCNCIFCILPPHILENISERGNDKQKERVTKLLAHDAQFRAHRKSLQKSAIQVEKAIPGMKSRQIFDAGFSQNLPGTLVRSEGDAPTTDNAVNEAYDGAGHTYDLYFNIYNRDFIK